MNILSSFYLSYVICKCPSCIHNVHVLFLSLSLSFYLLSYSTTVSDELIDLLSCLLEKDPHKRITIPQIRQHKWFNNSNRPIPSIEENCKGDILLTDKDIEEAVKEYQTPIHILVSVHVHELLVIYICVYWLVYMCLYITPYNNC